MTRQQDFDKSDTLPEAAFSTNAHVEVGGVRHQITARGTTATEMTSNYFEAVDALSAAYARRTQQIDPAKLLTLVQCGIQKALKHHDLERVARLMKAVQIVQAGGVTVETPGELYSVQSQTDASKGYLVTGAGACTCEDYARHAEDTERWYCKHSLAALAFHKLVESADA